MKIKRPKIGSLITGPIERGFPEPDSPKHDRSVVRERSPNRTQKNRTKSRRSKSRSSRFKN